MSIQNAERSIAADSDPICHQRWGRLALIDIGDSVYIAKERPDGGRDIIAIITLDDRWTPYTRTGAVERLGSIQVAVQNETKTSC
jgi:hypothetical protein